MADLHRQTTEAGHFSSASARVRLSCEKCQQRKIKCDKRDPCTNCQRIGITCVPVERARLPRGRTGRGATKGPLPKNTRLKDRISRLESLIRGIADCGSPSASSRALPYSTTSSCTRSQTSVSRTGSADGRSEAQEPDDDGSQIYPWIHALPQRHDTHRTQYHGQNTHSLNADDTAMRYQRLLSISKSAENEINAQTVDREAYVTRETEQKLCQIYLQRVDPVFKILHRPSLSTFLIEGKPYLDYEPGHLAPKALKYAVYYAAICSLDEVEYRYIFKTSKRVMVERYQKKSELILAQADYLATNDMTVLQAFVLFLLSSRSQDQSRRVWTMLSIALRIAQALCLHMAKPPFPVRPFESEMRRRLWSAIGFLDIQASTGCASEPMMQAAWLQSHPPSNINDHDINFEMGTLAPESEGFTDMTFTMIVLKAQYVFRLLNFSDFTEPTVKPIHLRQQLVVDFQHTASTLLHHIQADTIPFHWFTRQVAQYINASMQLITLRPLLRNPNYIPPRVHGDRLLRLAVDVLEKHQELRNNPRAFPWRWSEYMFMPWHALAVAASELSVCEDPVLMERFWTSVEQAQERLTSMVEDKSKDMFWKPMENIMAQAQARRNELLDLSSVGTRPLFSKSTPSDIVVSPMSPQSGHIQSMSRVSHNGVATGNMAPAAASSSSSSETIGLGSWSSVWDAVDFGNHLRENELSWLNYENFIDDLNSIIMPR